MGGMEKGGVNGVEKGRVSVLGGGQLPLLIVKKEKEEGVDIGVVT